MSRVDANLPEACDVAFKEWDAVCAALSAGRQSLILRKGGIEEGPGGFRPEHPAFWLYPTRVHQAQQGVKAEERRPSPLDGIGEHRVPLGTLCTVAMVARVERLDELEALDALHIWTRDTVEKRFHYRSPGLWVLGVRVYKSTEPTLLDVAPEFAGCKTWVPLGRSIPTRGLVQVLPDPAFEAEMGAIRAGLSSPTAVS